MINDAAKNNLQYWVCYEMSYIKHGTGLFRKTNFAFFAAGFNTFAILYSTQPLMREFSREFIISPTAASLSLSISTMTLAFSMLILGSLSEVWGRKSTMVYSMLIASVLSVITAFSSNFLILLGLRALVGIALAGVPSVAMAYLGEEIEANSLGKAMGLYISGNAFGAMGGRVVSGILSGFFGWHIAIGGIGIISFVATLIFWYTLRPSENFIPCKLEVSKLGKTMINHLQDPGLLSLYGLGFLLLGSNVALYNYIGYVLTSEPYSLKQGLVSWIYLLFIIGMFSSVWTGRLVDRFGKQNILFINLIIFILGACLTLNSLLFLKILGLSFTTFGFFGGHSIASGWVSKRALTNKAQASSLYLFLYYTGSSVGGTLGGIFWTKLGWEGLIGMVVGFIILALILTIYLTKITDTSKITVKKEKVSIY